MFSCIYRIYEKNTGKIQQYRHRGKTNGCQKWDMGDQVK